MAGKKSLGHIKTDLSVSDVLAKMQIVLYRTIFVLKYTEKGYHLKEKHVICVALFG